MDDDLGAGLVFKPGISCGMIKMAVGNKDLVFSGYVGRTELLTGSSGGIARQVRIYQKQASIGFDLKACGALPGEFHIASFCAMG